jgi:peptide/nickel transport system substrate-binding protein
MRQKIKKRNRMSLVALLSLISISLSGCAAPYEYQIVEGSEVIVASDQTFDNYNSRSTAESETKNSNVTYMTNSSFQYFNSDLQLVKNTNYGTFAKISDDPLTVKYTINSGVQWSDGTQIDGADMLLSWAATSGAFKKTKAEFFPDSTEGLDLVKETPIVDGRTITLVYEDSYVDWELAFEVGMPAHGTVMLAYPDITDPAEAKKQLIEAINSKDDKWLAPVAESWNEDYKFTSLPANPLKYLSSGPYILEEVVENQYVTLVSNPVYRWGPSSKFERITVRVYKDLKSQIQALELGDIDIAAGQPTIELIENAKMITGATLHYGEDSSFEHIDLTFNNGGPFDAATYGGDSSRAQKVRQAFLLAIPRNEILETIIKPLNPNATLRESFLTIPGSDRYNTIVASSGAADVRELDIQRAKALLREAGVTTPVNVKFWFPTGNLRRAHQFELIQKSASPAGFNVLATDEPNWTFTDYEIEPINPHDAVMFRWQSTPSAIGEAGEIFGSYEEPSDKKGNFNGFSNSDVDTLLEELRVTSEAEKQTEIMLQIEKVLISEAYGTTLFQLPGLTISSAKISGVKPSPLAPGYFWNFWDWTPVE